MKVVRAEEMREIERKAGELGISPLLLMENAGIATVSFILQVVGDVKGKVFTILAGRGNNGGDGFVVARHLFNRGASVKILLLPGKSSFSYEALTNYNIAKALSIPVIEVNSIDGEIKKILSHSEYIVDGIFGTGLSRNVTGLFSEVIDFVNGLNKTVFSIDIPSGINADTGEVLGTAIRADYTIALGLYKFGHLLFPGRAYAGKVFLADISIPANLTEKANYAEKISEEGVIKLFKKRAPDGHKGRYGHLALIGGSVGKTGAIVMAAKAALRVGAGLATIVCPHSLNSYVENAQLDVMTFPVADISGFISFAAVEAVKEFVDGKSAVVIGPGLSANETTEEFFFPFIKGLSKPAVIDADGLNLLAKNISVVEEKEVVLTPHMGEMARLIGKSKEEILKNPVETAKTFAMAHGVFLVLKSATTIFATPKGEIYISTLGTPGMAKAGVGDVLSGIIGGFLAQGYDLKEAVLLGLTVHGLAGELAGKRRGDTALMATDILEAIPCVLKKWEEEA